MGTFFSRPKSNKIKTKSLSSCPDANLADFMNKLSVIRIAVNAGGGFGHQAAAVTLMQRLKELGYRGKFHVVVPYWPFKSDSISHKIATLIPGYDPYNNNSQTIGDITIDRYSIDQDVLDFPPVGLTISAANDFDVISYTDFIKFNSACYLSMQPTGWGSSRVRASDVLSQESQHYIAENTVLFSENESQISMLPLTEARKSFLEKIKILKSNGVLTQSVYGFNFEEEQDPLYRPTGELSDRGTNRSFMKNTGWINPNIELTRLIQGASEAQNKLDKPILLLFHSDPTMISANFTSIPEITYLQALGKKIIFLSGIATDPNQQLDQYDGNTIIIWLTDSLPKDLFQKMLFDSDLPPVVEGANSTGFMEANRAYLHGGRKNRAFWHIPDEYFVTHNIDLALREQHLAANKLLESKEPGDPSILCRFYEDVLQGKYDQYFSVCASYFRNERPDAVLSGMEALMRNPALQESFSHKNLLDAFINFLEKELNQSITGQSFPHKKIMNLFKRVALLKERLSESLDDKVINKFQLIAESVANKLLIELSKAEDQSKKIGFKISEANSYRNDWFLIQKIAFPNRHIDLAEAQEQLRSSTSTAGASSLRINRP